jgi:hypothetical protein
MSIIGDGDLADKLVIIPCGHGKVWDDDPERGPAPAREAYTGAPFKVNRAYAEAFASRWVILSAKHGFIPPDFAIPGPYNVTFKKPATGPVDVATLIERIRDMRLDEHTRVIGLGGKEYRAAIEQAFTPYGRAVEFPFAGLPIGKAMQAIKRATGDPAPGARKLRSPGPSVLREGGMMSKIRN